MQFDNYASRRPMQMGTIPMSLTSLVYNVVFDTPLPDENYLVGFYRAGISMGLTTSNQTKNGFTVTIAIGITGDVQWVATSKW